VHLRLLHFFEDAGNASFHLANTAMFVAYLMDPDARAGSPPVAVRARFLDYARACFHEGKGNSSSLLDEKLGAEIGRVENVEAPWIAWLAAKARMPATREKYEIPAARSLRRLLIGR
jgi:hypothetical protein